MVAQQDLFIIQKGALGPVSLGMSAKALEALFPADRRRFIDLELEGEASPALALTLPNSKVRDGVTAELSGSPDQYRVFRIDITDPNARTEKGIGVDSTMAEVRAAYDVGKPIFLDEGCFCFEVEALHASFQLDTTGPNSTLIFKLRDTDSVPGTTKIRGILLW
jgi:hypothetical protein